MRDLEKSNARNDDPEGASSDKTETGFGLSLPFLQLLTNRTNERIRPVLHWLYNQAFATGETGENRNCLSLVTGTTAHCRHPLRLRRPDRKQSPPHPNPGGNGPRGLP